MYKHYSNKMNPFDKFLLHTAYNIVKANNPEIIELARALREQGQTWEVIRTKALQKFHNKGVVIDTIKACLSFMEVAEREQTELD